MKRELVAVLYADVAGYSRLTGENDANTHEQLNRGLDSISEKIVAHGGTKVHEAGDAILAEFSSATDAVDTAIEFQKSMSARQSNSTAGELIEFRIGINIGEITRDRGDIYGDGVNIAARIQELAQPGNLCVSSAVLDQLSANAGYNFDDLGFRKLKNINKPIHVFELRPSDLYDDHPMRKIESRVKGQPLFDDDIQKRLVTKGQCACGSVEFEINQETLGTGFCHCKICRRCTGAPVFAWAAFPTESIVFTRDEPEYYRLSLIAEKGFCRKCGTHMVWRSLKPERGNYLAVSTAILDNPEDFAPTWHGGIESQMPWLQIHDDLPRTRCEESPYLKKAWGSVGATDPDDWISLQYDQAKRLVDDPQSS